MEHVDLLAMDSEAFEAQVDRVDAAFADGFAAFVFDESASGWTIDLFRTDLNEAADTGLVTTADFAESLNDLLVFAFEGAPETVIRGWGKHHGEGSEDAAVTFTAILSAKLVHAKAEWERRRQGVISRTLANVVVSPVFDPSTATVSNILRLTAFQTTGFRQRPVAGTREIVEVSLTQRDLRSLIRKLEAGLQIAQFLGEGSDNE